MLRRIHVLAEVKKHSGIECPSSDAVDDADHSSENDCERSREFLGGKNFTVDQVVC